MLRKRKRKSRRIPSLNQSPKGIKKSLKKNKKNRIRRKSRSTILRSVKQSKVIVKTIPLKLSQLSDILTRMMIII